MQLPAIDQNVCGQWTEIDRDFYNKLDHYFDAFTADYRATWQSWKPRFKKTVKWKPNMGNTMRRVTQQFSPQIRQEAYPELIDDVPTTDITFTREATHDVRIYRHRFATRDFHFQPEFQDFFQHAEFEFEDLQKKIVEYEELFIRTRIWHHSPYVYVVGQGLITAPTGIGNSAGTAAKTDATVTQWLNNNVKPLTLEALFRILGIIESTVGMTPYEGSGKPQGKNKPLNQKYCLMLSHEAWMQFTNDPWAKENRPLAVDIVNQMLSGPKFGYIETDIEHKPLRFKMTAGTLSKPAPEIVSESQYSELTNRTSPNPVYGTEAQFEVAWLFGGHSYEPLDSGPPPALFTKSLDAARGMNWNGKPMWTKKFLKYCKNVDGTAVPEMAETWGESIRAQAQLAMGISAVNARNVLPIVFMRNSGISTTGTVN